jgi:hypothetical protein
VRDPQADSLATSRQAPRSRWCLLQHNSKAWHAGAFTSELDFDWRNDTLVVEDEGHSRQIKADLECNVLTVDLPIADGYIGPSKPVVDASQLSPSALNVKFTADPRWELRDCRSISHLHPRQTRQARARIIVASAINFISFPLIRSDTNTKDAYFRQNDAAFIQTMRAELPGGFER